MRELREIESAACLTLLEKERIGRLAYIDDGAPAIRPVNYFLADKESIVIRTHEGSGFSTLKGVRVAFEVDSIDAEHNSGWSVVASGTAEPITDIDELVRSADPRRRPWAPGDKGQFLRVRIEHVGGRELTQ
ncbi:pyridoxamine 5'-phosphate oxidase family protein [Hoyosella subflava]|uniref:Helix-turn-helix motif protein n=1 Tax=Hoyosella subflava (strain DSM 45089 / JCM 17490 / NBRC 109087 / DQS3-9A1) TaxID=443218 RepID=F6EHM5_HOYSD|nr:pyridoxamine 5'-phosphate oxidase family protein [Hoyosella subflava]AEF42389.1 Helix-turn-helix motif protein [Hoyosella subflava DQS3-9A1]